MEAVSARFVIGADATSKELDEPIGSAETVTVEMGGIHVSYLQRKVILFRSFVSTSDPASYSPSSHDMYALGGFTPPTYRDHAARSASAAALGRSRHAHHAPYASRTNTTAAMAANPIAQPASR